MSHHSIHIQMCDVLFGCLFVWKHIPTGKKFNGHAKWKFIKIIYCSTNYLFVESFFQDFQINKQIFCLTSCRIFETQIFKIAGFHRVENPMVMSFWNYICATKWLFHCLSSSHVYWYRVVIVLNATCRKPQSTHIKRIDV